ncbi:DUF6318 family protein [Pseudactinotalea sp. HY158]|uniref:DUF6318 family protein n=1 Tax=Pseudactinotalea sp. HY158 TaxID=2654547 RepID=UPI00129CE7E6|nr:DUF6318 family protein [Pseudactinotalea sp. HY158]QGH69480.1 hypothetical protein GCE65_08065 [Pseudactinotalea sp. HY158]
MLTRVGSRRTGIAATILAGTMLVTGCSGGDEPSAGPPTTDTAGPTTTEPPTTEQTTPSEEPVTEPSPLPKPERPAAMEDTGKKGAIAAAEYFFDLYNYAASTGDVESFLAMGHTSCDFCTKTASQFSARYDAGQWLTGLIATPRHLTAKRTIDDLAYEVTLDIEVSAGTVYSESGLESSVKALSQQDARIIMQHFDDWRAIGYFSGIDAQ